jgi:hypothetical protein
MIKLTSLLLTEAQSFPHWYHGRTVDSDVFSYDYIGGENAYDQEGPGFYFTSDFNNAKRYAENRGIILKCKINYKTLIIKSPTSNTKVNKKIVTDLILKSPNKDDVLTNFDENPKQALIQAINSYIGYEFAHDAYQTIANDFYKHTPKEYLQTISKYYDAQLTKLEGSTYGDLFHLIVYKPNIIQIIEKIYAKNFHEPI